MTGTGESLPPRVAVDTSVLFMGASLQSLVLAADQGLVVPIWSAHVAAELARTLLWHGKLDRGRRSITTTEYDDYRRRLYARVGDIDRRFEIMPVSQTAATADEAAWAAATDPNDLHIQLLARVAGADYVVSWNTRDFPGRQVVGRFTRGELGGIVWLTPEELFARPPELES